MNPRKLYEVEVTITSTHRYQVEARSPEEAEDEATNLFDDGDQGEVIDSLVDEAFAYPVEDEPLEEEDVEIDSND